MKQTVFRKVLPLAASALLLLPLRPGQTPAGERADSWRGRGAVPTIDETTPTFTIPDTSGREVSLGDYRGGVVLLSFFSGHADSCPPLANALKDLLATYGRDGLSVLSVCCDVHPSLAENDYAPLQRHFRLGGTLLVDEGGRLRSEYKVRYLPTTFILDRELRLRERVVGIRRLYTEEFRSLLAEVLAEGEGGR